MGKSCDRNAAETINKYLLSLSDKLAILISSRLGSTAEMDYLSFMEQAIKSKYPKIRINPVSIGKVEKIIYCFKNKDSCSYD
jgi:hypothetical protein